MYCQVGGEVVMYFEYVEELVVCVGIFVEVYQGVGYWQVEYLCQFGQWCCGIVYDYVVVGIDYWVFGGQEYFGGFVDLF